MKSYVKLGRCIKELERICGIQNGGNRGNQYKEAEPKLSEVPTQEQLADIIGISVDTLNNYKKLTELVPELQDWVDTRFLFTKIQNQHFCEQRIPKVSESIIYRRNT